MHTTISDGSEPPEVVLARVKEAGIGIFSVTDHDSVLAGRILPPLLDGEELRFIPGVEFSCRDEEGQYHILGYGFDPDHPAVVAVVELGHGYRMNKVRARLDFLRTQFGFSFPEEELAELLARPNPGKPHIANLMVKLGYAGSKEEAMSRYIDRLRFRSEYVRPEEAIRGILAAGGIPVLAHPSYGNGSQLILGGDMDRRIRRLREFGLRGLEAYYSGFTKKLRDELLSFAGTYGMYVTAGSDYHGANKLVELGDTGLSEVSDWPEGLRRFLRDVEKGPAKREKETP